MKILRERLADVLPGAVIRSRQRNGPKGTEKGILSDETLCDRMLSNHVRYDASELLERATPLAA